MKSHFWALLLAGIGIVSVASAGHWGRADNYGTHGGYRHGGYYGGSDCAGYGGGGWGHGHCSGWNGHHGGWGHGHCGGISDCGGWGHGHHGNDCSGYESDHDDDCDD